MIPANRPESELFQQLVLFRDGLSRLLNAILNRFFDVSPRPARRRFWSFIILFFVCGFLLSLTNENYEWSKWENRLQELFIYALNPAFRETYPGNAYINFLIFALTVFFDPVNLRYIPLLLAPFYFSLHFAAVYLADIFSLEDVSIARKHIREVALGGSDETIRISKGEVTEDSKTSPNYLIGGPGKVIVDLDSAVVFERPDGTARVIGPTGREPNGKAIIEGFERFREAFDLRDHSIDLRDQEEKSRSVYSRSKDGISISATDVRFVFSVDRNGFVATATTPYPFSIRAVYNLVYKAFSQVATGQVDASIYKFYWVNNMTNLVRGELISFMNRRRLAEYLASYGIPERERAGQREDDFTRHIQNLLTVGEGAPEQSVIPPALNFFPRPNITNLFNEFESFFSDTARSRGVVLKWIGVGTWKTPVEKVISEHLEAWKLSQLNRKESHNDTFDELTLQSRTGRTIGLIQDVPLAAFNKSADQRRKTKLVMWRLLLDYQKQIILARNLWTNVGEAPPQALIDAIQILDRILHNIRPNNPPPDNGVEPDDNDPNRGPLDGAPGAGAVAYETLVGMVGGNREVADRLIELERGHFPGEPRERLIERAIVRLERDRRV